ncbi:MAG: hypothetical protein COW30_07530 [Rhodospirillales bacterium CG15_BIG_FIL_POST_REV_8_21_14_020_66_15]|nr:MAG: hypothetical protein COW30_07530 [Rhodospirillales bacterium CG15_BIG_FIL_POST_REV_8_21_14_020_66_15]
MSVNDIKFKTSQGFLLTVAEVGDLSEELGHKRVKLHGGDLSLLVANGDMELIGADTLTWVKGRLPRQYDLEEAVFYTLHGVTDDELAQYTQADLERIAA